LSVETTVFTYYNSVLIFALSYQVAELSERLSAILPMKRSMNLSRSGLNDRQKIFIFSGINSLSEKCRKCIELSRDYIEKQSVVSILLYGRVAELFERPHAPLPANVAKTPLPLVQFIDRHNYLEF